MRLCIVGIVPIPDEYLDTIRSTVETCCRPVMHPDTQLEFRAVSTGPTHGPQGFEYHRNAYFERLVGDGVIEAILDIDDRSAAGEPSFDAFIINCFDDPGLVEARSLIEAPVFGLLEPTFAWASQLGTRFGALVPGLPGQVAYVTRQIERAGYADKLIPNGVRAEPCRFIESFPEAMANPQPMVERLADMAREMVDEGADVIVLACGGLGQICGTVGFHALQHREVSIPVVNPLTTAVKTAEMAVAMGKGLGYQIPSRVHSGTRLTPAERKQFQADFKLR